MIGFLLRRAEIMLAALLIAYTLAFFTLRLLPGDAVSDTLRRSGVSASVIAERRAALGLDEPILSQYLQSLGGVLRGDLGKSLVSGRAVSEVIGEQFPSTLILAAGALLVAIGLGLLLGMIIALNPTALLRTTARTLTALSMASPVYWTGTLAIYIFSVQLRWVPSTGSDNDLRHLLLPWLVLGFGLSGAIAQVVASNVSYSKRAEHVRFAQAKGLRDRLIALHHILRPSLPPIIAVVALQTGFLLGGTALTEMLFVRRGIGQVMIQAVNERDFTVVQGAVIISALIYSVITALADLLTAIVDPRVRDTLLPNAS
ncbi:MAG: ABC transporter permease [Anaerolineae bacterium]|nr:ABC transporter permease [Anaerolineae bacterium]